MRITIPDFSLVALIGASGSGKSTFARNHFRDTEVVSSDRCRALVADDETDQSATRDAFEVLYTIAGKRLASRRIAVIDATNLRPEDRAVGIALARSYHALPVAIVLNIAADLSIARNRDRRDRTFGPRVVHDHVRLLHKSLRNLRREGYRAIYVLDSEDAISRAEIVREPLYNDKRNERGPFDIIGDVHGCIDELTALLTRLGYSRDAERWRHPLGRRVIFLGDLVDRGPGVVEVVDLVMQMVGDGIALCVPGNHEIKLGRKLAGRDVTISHGLAETLAQIDALPDERRSAFTRDAVAFIDGLVSHYWLDGGKLVVAHAGLRETMHGRGSREVREFALYGETDEFGLPVRYDWATEYRGESIVAYGHTPVPSAQWVNKTICLDTGCVYGGALTAMRYPELELVAEPARRVYVKPVRPLAPAVPNVTATAQQLADDVLSIDDVAGKRRVANRFGPPVLVPAENAAAALEVMSRFCADPRWLIYLPPTMSPSETSTRDGQLEHPDEAFSYFRRSGVARVVMEEKHMGSRAVLIVGRDEHAIKRRFGIEQRSGVILTRTGREFFTGRERDLGEALIGRVAQALTAATFWERFETDWVCIDAEILPWSAKAQQLIDDQYEPVAQAALADLRFAERILAQTASRGVDVADALDRVRQRHACAAAYAHAFRRYVRPVTTVADLRLAPFHILASEGHVYAERDHVWHINELAKVCLQDPAIMLATALREVTLDDAAEVSAAVEWWESLTANGGEGAVVKPRDFIARSGSKLVQPALKVRGREYLRIVYGPEYTLRDNLERLRERGIAGKRRLALAEFALGLEALHRFIERAPLRMTHECVFAILALESEPIDPRL